MRLGIAVLRFDWDGVPHAIGPTVGRLGRRADQAGLDSFWVMDHFFPPTGGPDGPMLECYTTLAYVAGQTRTIKLGALVTGVVYRHPGVLVKTASTLDVLSNGRAYLGIGAAWNEAESRGLGIPFPPLRERFERLEETLRIARQMWAGDDREFRGEHYHLTRPLNSPNSIQRPRPPILIGGGGMNKTLRLVAQYADACNLFDTSWGEPFEPRLDALRNHCAEVGRDYAEIEKTVYCDAPMSRRKDADALLERMNEHAAHGFDHVIVGLPHSDGERAIDHLAEIATEAAAIVPSGR
jgi:F420-dependent oxidoreductase-like protein